ncbi:hypothetical protein KJS94_11090 [Flavihumibacter rivuli]|uniref:hypothetical protein n=1 Tax=Flavihumibacter rivuli TaxID=2838156 RepID=UPI001BDEF076|nr:hypothetical protein [Flavihumibacter rivuli]ULQ55186.1 hypothetical protein KJS94_11090 [Flavihumibacter rivuli]
MQAKLIFVGLAIGSSLVFADFSIYIQPKSLPLKLHAPRPAKTFTPVQYGPIGAFLELN